MIIFVKRDNMKKLILLLLLAIPYYSESQVRSCCQVSATEQFGQLALNKAFVAGHESPLPFSFTPLEGEMINFICPDSSQSSAFEIRASSFTNNWLIVVHEWWGLNDYIKREAERLQLELSKINILAIDLYDGKIAETPAMAQQLLGSLKEERAKNIIRGAINHTGANSKIYTIGWCMGGGWAFQTSLLAGAKSTACVFFYGMPESDVNKLKKMSGDVFGIFATRDEWISPEIMKQFQENMKQANKNVVVKSFEADHAFANPSNPKFDEKAAGEANKLAVEFIKKRLK